MQMVIELPDETVTSIKEHGAITATLQHDVLSAIKEGIPVKNETIVEEHRIVHHVYKPL